MIDVSAKTLNVAAPDTHTNYFVQPFYLTAGNQIVVQGTYPYSRYFSFIAYGSDGSPINNVSIHDQQIIPGAGSTNPFTTADPVPDQNRQYTLRVRQPVRVQASTWSPGTIIVIRGKAMTYPDTRNGQSVTTPSDVRYRSMCSNEFQEPLPAVDCGSDD